LRNKSIFLNRNFQSKRAWNDVFQDLKENNFQLCPAKLSFINEEGSKNLP
jgi:hypothetical protein